MSDNLTQDELKGLLEDCRAGNEDSKQRLMEIIAETIQPVALKMCKSKAPLLNETYASEAVNNAIIKLFPLTRDAGIYTIIDAKTVKGYAVVVAVNEVHNLMRIQQKLNNLGRLDQEDESGRSLLDTIIDTMAANPADLSEETQKAEKQKRLQQLRGILHDVMEELRPEERAAIYFRYMVHPDKEIAIRHVADLMHTTEDNANNWIYRGLKKLMEALKDTDINNVI